MKPASLLLAALGLCFFLDVTHCLADIGLPAKPALTQSINPSDGNVTVGQEFSITLSVQNGDIKKMQVDIGFGTMDTEEISLPNIDGLRRTNHDFSQSSSVNGLNSSALSISLVATRVGTFTIPAFDVPLEDGTVLHAQPMKIHVADDSSATAPAINPPALTPAQNPPDQNSNPLPDFNPHGPVVMPPPNQQAGTPQNQPDTATPAQSESTANNGVPTESDGRPAKVFIIATPESNEAYVGQSVPLRIDFYIRQDVIAPQDSLPTIKGSDFLMNSLSIRPQEDDAVVMNEMYVRETWITAIAAPKPGDFPLQIERDTYWTKPNTSISADPFGNIGIVRPQLAHEMIASNHFVFHVHPLPDEGRPANFTGAIGHLKAGSAADPLSVAVGEPVIVHFTIGGDGNFNYVRCPTLAADPAWKSYDPRSRMQYRDQSETTGVKFFDQEVVPQKNGALPLPKASFSYFDPDAKKYVTIPIDLPTVTVTGSSVVAAPVASANNSKTGSVAAPQTDGFLQNRLDFGSTLASLSPLYRQTWFWAVQGGLLTAVVAGAVFVGVRRRSAGTELAEKLRKQQARSLHREEDAMKAAVQKGDAQAFFLAARHALQIRLGSQWGLLPEAITLGEIRRRDPALAEALEPLFQQADEVIYSGQAAAKLDLAQWERHTRELLQPA